MATAFIISYNGGTTDNRVMKHARAMVSAGYETHLLCNLADGRPKRETVGGIQIHRFPVFSATGFDRLDRAAELTSFLTTSGAELAHSTGAVIEYHRQKSFLCRQLARLDEGGQALGLLVPKKKYKKYKQYSGAKALFYRIGYLLARCCSQCLGLRRSKEAISKLSTIRSEIAAELQALTEQKNAYAAWHFRARYGLLAMNLARYADSPAALPHRPDTIHAHDLYTLPAAIMLAKRLGGKVVYDAHEIEIERNPPLKPRRKNFVDRLESDCLPFVDALVTVSNGCGAFYRERFKKCLPVIVMNSPEELSLRPFEGADVRAQAGVEAKTPLIVYTGIVAKAGRGLDKVVAALALLPDYHLAILGSRHAGNDAWLMCHVARHGVCDRVHLLDPVAPEHVVDAIRTADVAVCPIQDTSLSYRHSLPNKLFEAAMAELPICVSDLPDMRHFVEELGIGIVMDQIKPDSIAAALELAFNQKESYRSSEHTKHLLANKYGWLAQVKTLLNLYDSLLQPPGKTLKLNIESRGRSIAAITGA